MSDENEDVLKCERCGREFPAEDLIEDGGARICENCYINAHQKIKVCDPWAVRSKKILREKAGLVGAEGLTDIQREIYEFIISKGGATREEIAKQFDLPAEELENQFAILRHCELVKGQKRDDGVYIVVFKD
ncbi:MAG TPA: helix-turn-helix transcriptional regulator [Methanotrichaceae archaeon]|nr:helix-turn-helix transcriptional regulator [Methanotrichaceae archaeon]